MKEWLLSFFFPPKCPYCLKWIDYRKTECDECLAAFKGYAYEKHTPTDELCVAPFLYKDRIREAIIRYKFNGHKNYCKSFGKMIAYTIRDTYGIDNFDMITCVPLYYARKRSRGYDQAELLAQRAALLLAKPYEPLLDKVKNNLEQHNLNSEERKDNVIGVYSALDREKVNNKRILIIDDVITTGATISECCKSLREAGAKKVICASIAIAMYRSAENGGVSS